MVLGKWKFKLYTIWQWIDSHKKVTFGSIAKKKICLRKTGNLNTWDEYKLRKGFSERVLYFMTRFYEKFSWEIAMNSPFSPEPLNPGSVSDKGATTKTFRMMETWYFGTSLLYYINE